jgi:inner membrane protein
MAWWLWLVLGFVLAGLELASAGGFYLIFFGVSALLLGLLGLIGITGPYWAQWLSFTVVAVVLVLAFRRPTLRLMRLEEHEVDSLIGEIAVVSEAIAPGGIGRAELRGTSWAARNGHSAELVRGQRCRVARVNGLQLILLPE